MATTTYVTKEEWADAHGFTDWDSFSSEESGDEDWPNSTILDAKLLKSSRIINNSQHLNTRGTNVTNADYLPDIKDYVIVMTDRQLDQFNIRGGGLLFTQGLQNWSGADYLMSYERSDINNIAMELGFRVVGGVG